MESSQWVNGPEAWHPRCVRGISALRSPAFQIESHGTWPSWEQEAHLRPSLTPRVCASRPPSQVEEWQPEIKVYAPLTSPTFKDSYSDAGAESEGASAAEVPSRSARSNSRAKASCHSWTASASVCAFAQLAALGRLCSRCPQIARLAKGVDRLALGFSSCFTCFVARLLSHGRHETGAAATSMAQGQHSKPESGLHRPCEGRYSHLLTRDVKIRGPCLVRKLQCHEGGQERQKGAWLLPTSPIASSQDSRLTAPPNVIYV